MNTVDLSKRATYSYSQIDAAFKTLKAFPKTTIKKAEHHHKLEEIRKLMWDVLYPINNYLFTPECNYSFENYQNAVKQQLTKKVMDDRLNYFFVSQWNELISIRRDMEYGEVNAIA